MAVGAWLALTLIGLLIVQAMQPDGTGIPVQFDPEFLARFQSKPAGVGMADQEVAVPMNPRSEVSLASTGFTGCAGSAAGAGELPPLSLSFGFDQGSVEALLEKPSAWSDVTTAPGDVILRPIAQGSRLVKQFFADEHWRY